MPTKAVHKIPKIWVQKLCRAPLPPSGDPTSTSSQQAQWGADMAWAALPILASHEQSRHLWLFQSCGDGLHPGANSQNKELNKASLDPFCGRKALSFRDALSVTASSATGHKTWGHSQGLQLAVILCRARPQCSARFPKGR